jgi:hypothetical protein
VPTKKPVFISFVGKAPQTDRLYEAFETRVRREYPNLKFEFLGNPFEHYPTMRIDEKPKHEYSPAARTFFRLGLFYEFNERVVQPAFDRGHDFVVVRAYGYDLYRDAIEYRDCDISLEIHKNNLQYTVLGHGLCPPVYLFTQEVTPADRIRMDRYFKEGSGQKSHVLDPTLSINAKVDRILSMYGQGMLRHQELQVA